MRVCGGCVYLWRVAHFSPSSHSTQSHSAQNTSWKRINLPIDISKPDQQDDMKLKTVALSSSQRLTNFLCFLVSSIGREIWDLDMYRSSHASSKVWWTACNITIVLITSKLNTINGLHSLEHLIQVWEDIKQVTSLLHAPVRGAMVGLVHLRRNNKESPLLLILTWYVIDLPLQTKWYASYPPTANSHAHKANQNWYLYKGWIIEKKKLVRVYNACA